VSGSSVEYVAWSNDKKTWKNYVDNSDSANIIVAVNRRPVAAPSPPGPQGAVVGPAVEPAMRPTQQQAVVVPAKVPAQQQVPAVARPGPSQQQQGRVPPVGPVVSPGSRVSLTGLTEKQITELDPHAKVFVVKSTSHADAAGYYCHEGSSKWVRYAVAAAKPGPVYHLVESWGGTLTLAPSNGGGALTTWSMKGDRIDIGRAAQDSQRTTSVQCFARNGAWNGATTKGLVYRVTNTQTGTVTAEYRLLPFLMGAFLFGDVWRLEGSSDVYLTSTGIPHVGGPDEKRGTIFMYRVLPNKIMVVTMYLDKAGKWINAFSETEVPGVQIHVAM
jgi:hypothetical protein